MAMTKKFKVSFNVTAVMPSDVEAALFEDVKRLAKMVRDGDESVSHKQREMLVQFLTNGMEGLMAFVVKQALRESIKEMKEEYADGDCFKFSPATVREVF